jgi:hypothetical protein
MEHTKQYVLGVVGSTAFNVESNVEEYILKLYVTESVYEWLLSHDVEIHPGGKRFFICNRVKYEDLGPHIKAIKKDEEN